MRNDLPSARDAALESLLVTASPQLAAAYLRTVAEAIAGDLMPALEGDTKKKAFDCLKTVVRLACAVEPSDDVRRVLCGPDGLDDPAAAEGRAVELHDRDALARVEALLAGSRPPARAFDAAALEAYLRRHPLGGPDLRIDEAKLLVGGRQKVTVLVTQRGARALPGDIVIRQDWTNSITGGTVGDEYDVLVRLHEAGIKVPKPFLVERSADAIGAPFVVVSREPGRTAGGDRFFVPECGTPALLELAAELGRIHALGTAPFDDLERLTRRECTADEMRRELKVFAQGIANAEPQPSPLLQGAIAWLDANAECIEGFPPGLVHGDVGVHNMLYDDEHLLALLDWELVHLGHPAFDLGYVRLSVKDDGLYERFLGAYRDAGGPRIPLQVIDYFAIRACVWFHYVALAARAGLLAGKITEVDVAVVLANTVPQSLAALSRTLRKRLSEQERATSGTEQGGAAWTTAAAENAPLWSPSDQQIASAGITTFTAHARAATGLPLADYAALHDWSIQSPLAFWRQVWEFGGVIGAQGERGLVDAERMPGAKWFPDARLNFAENLLRESSNPQALVFRGEDKLERRMTRVELRIEVARFAAALRALGVQPGDRVAAFMPNMPETLVAMLAASSIGAVFTSASPDFGVQGVLDRFGQTEPKLLIACDGYWYNGKAIDVRPKLADSCRNCRASSGSSSCPISRRESPSTRRPAAGAVLRRLRRAAPRRDPAAVRAPAVQPSALRDVFVGHDRRAQMHRARRRRHAAAAPEGTQAARRREGRRQALLLHDLRLDDVELARLRTCRRRDADALRRQPLRRRGPHPVGLRRARAHHAFRHVGEIHRDARKRHRPAGGIA